MSEELKKCPFCGKEGYITLYDNGVAIFWHKHETCDLGFSEFRISDCNSTEEAIRRWNTRRECTVDQWHYPSKGEYPTELDRYLCLIDKNMPMVLEYTEEDDGTKVWFDELGGDVVDSVYAWQYIDPPKEEE